MKRIADSCKKYGAPLPKISNQTGGVMVECEASETYLNAMNGKSEPTIKLKNDTENVTNVTKDVTNVTKNVIEDLNEIDYEILKIIIENNKITQKEIANKLNISTRTVKRGTDKLKKKAIIERIGSNRKGYWKINNSYK